MTSSSIPSQRWATVLFLGALLLFAAGSRPSYALDLREAIQRSLASDPRLTAGRFEIEAARGGVIQAGKRPNPELSVDLEDFGGSGEYRGVESATLTIALSQKFELGGKRDARLAVAHGKEDVANAEIAVLMRDIIAQTKLDYIQVLGAQRRVELLTSAAKRFDDLVPALRRRVEAGASPQADVTRGEVAAAVARVAIDKAASELTNAKRQLVSNWSGILRDASVVAGHLRHNGHRPAPIQVLLANVDEHPAVRAWAAVYAQRRGELALQGATAVPDLTLGGGVSRMFDTDDTAFRLSGSIPLPVHDRNEGGIYEAEQRLAKTAHYRNATRVQLRRKIIEAYTEFEASCIEARRLLDDILPLSRRATENVQSSFQQGRLTVKDLLDANRDQYDTEVQQLDADIRCHMGAAKIEALTARSPFQHGWEAVTRRQ
ncbi:TolC family protein [Hyphomicrobium sp. CS1BSMeth3]|uniref:TolC family protein n=1 Tax=Hyphomicrobium sp. CS1BSMeth3 TaxID=1892844 RepID=UPI0009F98EC0|nr:TolC family protein [Hyphomicrobium sp. CS1BSMeth3]